MIYRNTIKYCEKSFIVHTWYTSPQKLKLIVIIIATITSIVPNTTVSIKQVVGAQNMTYTTDRL